MMIDSLKQFYSQYLDGIEQFARKLLQVQSLQDIWQIELDLINYQIELQETISREKGNKQSIESQIAEIAVRRQGDWKAQIRILQGDLDYTLSQIKVCKHVYHLSRRFGDAVAWALLGGDEQKILPLTENKPNPLIPTGDSLKGVLTIAASHSNAGAGFPLVHDMTNILRIGDMTFVSPGNEPITIEVKTHLVNREKDATELLVETHALVEPERWNAIDSSFQQQESGVIDSLSTTNLPKKRLDAQLKRQIERMKRVKTFQTTQPGTVLKNFDPPCIIARTPSTRESHHWDIANEAAKGAKANGYASQVVDGAFLYVAIYSDSPLSYPWSQDIDIPSLEKIPTDLVNSSIFFTDPTKNALWFGSTWSHITNEAPSHVYPLFLHPFPIDLLLDMVRGRLFLVIFVNLGKVTEAIQRAGYEARLPKDESEVQQYFIPTSAKISTFDNTIMKMQLEGLYYFGVKLAYEYLSLKGFVDIVSTMAEAGADIIKREFE